VSGPAGIPFLAGKQPDQIGIIVPSLDEGVRRYTELWGLGPWVGWTYGPDTVPRLGYRGGPGSYTLRLALTGAGPQIELIESVRGPSIYEEWLAEHGPGLHHLGFWVASLDDAVTQMEAAGFSLVQSGAGYGLHGDGAFGYFDTREALGVTLEAIELVRERRPPDFFWPVA
jgi:catechol 2,3-dioxygenase-like lactoylglutathione lyase family enzyme